MKKYIINEKRLTELLEAECTLGALDAGGVDNWDGYDLSLEAMEGFDGERLIEDFEEYKQNL